MKYQDFIKKQQEIKTEISDCKCGFEICTDREAEYINVEVDFHRRHILLQTSSQSLWLQPKHLIELRDKLSEMFPKEDDEKYESNSS